MDTSLFENAKEFHTITLQRPDIFGVDTVEIPCFLGNGRGYGNVIVNGIEHFVFLKYPTIEEVTSNIEMFNDIKELLYGKGEVDISVADIASLAQISHHLTF
jgi:hypothetical protein